MINDIICRAIDIETQAADPGFIRLDTHHLIRALPLCQCPRDIASSDTDRAISGQDGVKLARIQLDIVDARRDQGLIARCQEAGQDQFRRNRIAYGHWLTGSAKPGL